MGHSKSEIPLSKTQRNLDVHLRKFGKKWDLEFTPTAAERWKFVSWDGKISYQDKITHPNLKGVYDHCNIEITYFELDLSNSFGIQIIMDLNNPHDFSMTLERETKTSLLMRKFGINDIHSGNERFDQDFKITGSDKEFVRSLLIPPLMNLMIKAWITLKGGGKLSLNSYDIIYQEPFTGFSSSRLSTILELLSKIKEGLINWDLFKQENFDQEAPQKGEAF